MPLSKRSSLQLLLMTGVFAAAAGTAIAFFTWQPRRLEKKSVVIQYAPHKGLETTGYTLMHNNVVPHWGSDATLKEIKDLWDGAARRAIDAADKQLAQMSGSDQEITSLLYKKGALLNYEGRAKEAYQAFSDLRSRIETDNVAAQEMLYSIIYLQGVTALRRGENENCIMCRGESSCILPIAPSARHINPAGSRLAVQHFTEYLDEFPGDLGAMWLLNLAHMTLGEYPSGVDPRHLITLDQFTKSEFDIGKFRDLGHLAGVNQFTQAGGAIMEDFDNDGLLDIVITTFDPTGQMSFLRNSGDGTFEDRTPTAGMDGQFGGLNCVQTDYNNDGYADIYIMRGAWLMSPVRPTLLRNNQDGTFTDVTLEAGLLHPVNSIAATWADYDNDGWLDLFVCCEQQSSRLFHNLGNGTFEQVLEKSGLQMRRAICKGAAWIDYDNDNYPDLFLNYLTGPGAQLFHNQHDGTFQDVTTAMNIDGPTSGFSCWAWDYDNDGWLDIFATCYDRTLADVVRGLKGQPHERMSNRLFHNLEGKRFKDVTEEAGLDMVLVTMGSNFADFDNDGFLDMYLGTGEPEYATLIPNRMFKNVAGRRFADITASSGTGTLQKGHGVACGDWDRDGDIDLYLEMGGAVPGDKYHNILFQNPGQKNHSLTVKLIGQKTNRAAIGARIKIVTAGDTPQTFYRHVSTGSSFGANPLQQTIGVGTADRIATLEIHWPTSGTDQVFHNVAANQAISITEFADDYERLEWTSIKLDESKDDKTMSASK
jgi:hypothetical protein